MRRRHRTACAAAAAGMLLIGIWQLVSNVRGVSATVSLARSMQTGLAVFSRPLLSQGLFIVEDLLLCAGGICGTAFAVRRSAPGLRLLRTARAAAAGALILECAALAVSLWGSGGFLAAVAVLSGILRMIFPVLMLLFSSGGSEEDGREKS